MTRRVQDDPTFSLADACVDWVTRRIDGDVLRAGMRLPSIRALARQRKVSPFTVAEAYQRLVAAGRIEAKRGSGYYVRGRSSPAPDASLRRGDAIDLAWLLGHMLESGRARGPGLGSLPREWLDGARLGMGLRALGRQGRWLDSGRPLGHEPLRGVLQHRLADLEVIAHPEQIVLTTGIIHALDLVLRTLVPSGGTVLVLDPGWFGARALLGAHGARVLGVACTPRGPDLDALERLAREQRPQLLVIGAAAQNPTGLSLTTGVAERILAIARRYDFAIFEDDVYADLCEQPSPRLAALDGLDRVVYAGSFSKTLAANVRVGFLACRAELARAFADAKILSGFTTPEINERLVHWLLVEGRYSRHVARLRERLARERKRTLGLLRGAGLELFAADGDGLFAWTDTRMDTSTLAAAMAKQGLLVAPGALFSPTQTPSTWMRVNLATPEDELQATLQALARDRRRSVTRRTAS